MRFKSRSRALAASALAASLGLAGLTMVAPTAQAAEPDAVRVAGNGRYETAADAATMAFPDGADTVVLTTGQAFPDALAANGLAGANDGPILLTQSDSLPDATSDALTELDPTTVIIVGGEGAVSADVEAALAADYTVERIAGENRFDTAEQVATEIGTAPDLDAGDGAKSTVVLANGLNFPDAVAMSPGLHSLGLPLLLTTADTLNEDAKAGIDGLAAEQVVILGGTAAVSQDVEDALEADGHDVVRLAGENRFETAVAVAEFHLTAGFDAANTFLATGMKFPDALAGGPLASVKNGPLVLTGSLPDATKGFLEDNAADIDTLYVLGGTAVIDDDTVEAAQAAADQGSNQTFAITPADDATLIRVANPDTNTTDDRQFTVSGLDNAKTYTLGLFAGADVNDDDGTITFDDANSDNVADVTAVVTDITVVNGAAQPVNTTKVTVMPVGGTISFTIDGDGANEVVVPVLWTDTTAGGTINLVAPTTANNQPKEATEAFGVGGRTTYAPPAATTGDLTGAADDVAITGVDKAADTITTADFLYKYDANDTFYMRSTDSAAGPNAGTPAEQVTMAQFEAKVSAGDELDEATFYNATPELPSSFVLENLSPAAPAGLAVTPKATTAVGTVNTASVVSGATVTMKVVADGGLCTAPAVVTASSATDQDATTPEFQVNITGLTVSTNYELCAYQTVGGEDSGFDGPIALNTTATADTTAPIISKTLRTGDEAPGGIFITAAGTSDDEITIDFNEAMKAAGPGLGDTDATYIRVSDGTDTFQITCENNALNDATDGCDLLDGPGSAGADDQLVIDMADADVTITRIAGTGALDIATETVTITLLSPAFDDVAGNQTNLAGSTDVKVDDA